MEYTDYAVMAAAESWRFRGRSPRKKSWRWSILGIFFGKGRRAPQLQTV